MPKPPMNDTIYIYDAFTGNSEHYDQSLVDDYGRPKFKDPRTSKARVQPELKVITTPDGENFESVLTIDIPPETFIQRGHDINWTDRFGQDIKGRISEVEETLNFSGTKVYFRTVYVGKPPPR
ncbi:hypothetical protein [Domibacillus mangrovi]|uniref:Uncharacterized protein n=1 Tax=Domibacillus mangrovi TaxID=1714354 RepID=A0A1Q5P414_9BACI|nr:hypothetical protein [Domibacillus mangrovi]OKL36995.1 hypothetical protein BLL40_05230 [Domibacillus mangrovi]